MPATSPKSCGTIVRIFRATQRDSMRSSLLPPSPTDTYTCRRLPTRSSYTDCNRRAALQSPVAYPLKEGAAHSLDGACAIGIGSDAKRPDGERANHQRSDHRRPHRNVDATHTHGPPENDSEELDAGQQN